MILNSDIMLNHPLWERADDELCGKDGVGFFNRLVDLYILACSIGIREDKTITDFETDGSPKRTIGRNTYMSMTNTDLRDLLDFMLQNAILNSKLLDLSNDERLKLAFDPDYNVPKLSPTSFLTGFANYGIDQIMKKVDSQSPLVVINELYKYFEEIADSRYEELLRNITLDDIK